MFGFVIGTLCLIGLIATLRRGRHGYGGHCGGGFRRGFGGGGWGGGGFGGGGFGGDYGPPPWARRGPFGDHDHHGHHGHHGHHDHPRGDGDGRGWGRGFGFRGPRDFILRRLSERLDATPGQEKVIAKALDEVHEAMHAAKKQWKGSRGDVAKAVRGDHFDAVHLGETFAKHDEAIDGLRKAFTSAMQSVHDVLDERQRAVLADLIEGGGFFGGFGGPYRSAEQL